MFGVCSSTASLRTGAVSTKLIIILFLKRLASVMVPSLYPLENIVKMGVARASCLLHRYPDLEQSTAAYAWFLLFVFSAACVEETSVVELSSHLLVVSHTNRNYNR